MIGLRSVVTALRRYYGKPAAPISRDPLRLILWEQVAYLVPDAQRRRAFIALRDEVGLEPTEILAAPMARLEAITRLGGSIAARVRAARLRESAEFVLGDWDGDLRNALRLPLPQARRALTRFAMIGEPSADRILVIAKKAQLLPLDSNALRVVQRLGLTTASRDYRGSYRRAQETLAPGLRKDHAWLLDASTLLRQHGQELCRRSKPACARCPFGASCPSSTKEAGRGARN